MGEISIQFTSVFVTGEYGVASVHTCRRFKSVTF